jgi:hypothetical protein
MTEHKTKEDKQHIALKTALMISSCEFRAKTLSQFTSSGLQKIMFSKSLLDAAQ